MKVIILILILFCCTCTDAQEMISIEECDNQKAEIVHDATKVITNAVNTIQEYDIEVKKCNEAYKELRINHEKLAELAIEAQDRSWYENPYITVPLGIAFGAMAWESVR